MSNSGDLVDPRDYDSGRPSGRHSQPHPDTTSGSRYDDEPRQLNPDADLVRPRSGRSWHHAPLRPRTWLFAGLAVAAVITGVAWVWGRAHQVKPPDTGNQPVPKVETSIGALGEPSVEHDKQQQLENIIAAKYKELHAGDPTPLVVPEASVTATDLSVGSANSITISI